ncbi:hypothetical protein GN958_ATG19076 [Phytophthora infestans]|uniref:Uncharacterized protein n=1 Tax=Phytophthora infestans TaxID=4787 RepID=A0A8S9U0N2_PHYIN|nr:hypothetical protein GN958_ATG19076 [Phytophthora infestans]
MVSFAGGLKRFVSTSISFAGSVSLAKSLPVRRSPCTYLAREVSFQCSAGTSVVDWRVCYQQPTNSDGQQAPRDPGLLKHDRKEIRRMQDKIDSAGS